MSLYSANPHILVPKCNTELILAFYSMLFRIILCAYNVRLCVGNRENNLFVPRVKRYE